MTRAARQLCLWLLPALVCLAACGGPPNAKLAPIEKKIERAAQQGAKFCAPREFASAEALLEFAAQAYEQGNRTQGDEFLGQADTHADAALAGSINCRSDLDGDGVLDVRDADPHRAEDFDGFQDNDGAPEDDNDGDGFLDGEDKCPNEPEDFDGYEDSDGCPDNDNDYDGVPDDQDQCPDQIEDMDGFEDDDGCPDPDNDGDGFPDDEDLCPNHPETFNGFLDDDGCPDQLPKRRKFIALPQVDFLGGAPYMTPESADSLKRFAKRLHKNPELHVRIESHLDQRGDEAALAALTSQRAEAVKAVLVETGIHESRLKALGFGSQRPVADNNTFAGRRKNDRVEFIIYLP